MSHPTVKRYIDLFSETYVTRVLRPYFVNIRKRLVKSPKVYLRDSGLLHQLLNIRSFNELLGHHIAGSSWEGVVVENICSQFHPSETFFYRNATSDELDLIVCSGGKVTAVECKASQAPTLGKGFWRALEQVNADRAYVVAPISGCYPIADKVEVCGLQEVLCRIES